MIYCPVCGTANRDGSKFCNECGERFGSQTRIKCPNCETWNPVQNAFCSVCGQRIVSLPPKPSAEAPPPIKGLSLPVKSAAAGVEGEKAHPAAPADEEDVPAWLRELEASLSAEGAAGKAPLTEPTEIPDWLRDLRDSLPPEPPAESPQPAGPEEEIPAWLAELRPGAPPPAEARPAPPAPEPEEEAPDWLAELRPTEEAPEFSVGTTRPSALPDWLAELEPKPLAKAPKAGEEALWAEGELPDWLVPSEEGLAELAEEETLERAEIPDWLLALKPRELRKEEVKAPAPAIEAAVEETGLLAGIQGVLPVEMIIAQPRAARAGEEVAPIVETPQARLFAEIVARPPAVAPKAMPRPRAGMLSLLPRWIIFLSLIAAVTLPLLLDRPLLARTIEPPATVSDLYRQIATLKSGARVLVAFDYDPTASGEMDVVAQALIGHLMDRQARIVAVSLLPAGAGRAERLLAGQAASRPGYNDGYGRLYVNLGYLPGQVTAVRMLGESLRTALPADFHGTSLADLEIMNQVTTVRDLDLVLELAAGQDSLRWWIEQVGTPYGVPLAAGTSAVVEPFARAYYQTGRRQLVGLVAGVPDAVAYEALAGGSAGLTGIAAARLDSQLGGHLVFILVILIGNVAYLVQRRGGRNR